MDSRVEFNARCARVAAEARNAGVTVRKRDDAHAIELSGNGGTVVFPIVTDAATWRETSADEAFYAAMCDARAWGKAHVDEASVAQMSDRIEVDELPLIRRDLGEERARLEACATVFGGRAKLDRLL